MATNSRVEKLYSLKTLGYSDIIKELNNVEKAFAAIKKTKQDLNNLKAKIDDPVELQRLNKELEEQAIKSAELLIEKQKLTNEAKAAQNIRQAEINQRKEEKASVQAATGSYAALYLEYKQLYALVKAAPKGSPITFQGQTLGYDQAITKLKQLSTEEQNFRRQFARDSLLVGEYTSGIVQAFKSMGLGDLVGGQITKAQERLSQLNGDFDRLQQELKETRAAGQSTDTIEKQMIENRNEVIQLDTQLARLKTDLRGVGDVGSQINTSLSNGFRSLKGQLGSFALQFIGIQALVNKLQSGLSDAKLSSDLTTDLQIQLGATADEADKLNVSLKALNTRTTLAGLQEIANVALKAGVTGDNIAAVTEAIDKTKVAFGKDFGSIEQGTETFAKLINIFFEDGQITGDRILRIGNAIRALANETVASVPFLTDFSGRMAGVKQISNISLPDILGLGAGFEEFKQSAEVASTTLVKLIPKLGKDLEKFAEIAGLASDEFKKLLTDNPAEALIKVAEGLVKGKGDVEEFAKSLADAGLDAGRVTTIIATLGGKADVFRDRIARAGVTIQDTAAITDAFEKKNTNLAASMDKLNKKFSDFFASKTFQQGLQGVLSVMLALLKILPVLIAGIALYAAESFRAYIATQLASKQGLIWGATMVVQRISTVAANIALTAYYGAIALFTGGLTKATVATRIFSSVLRAFPLGAILTVVGLIAGAFVVFGRTLTGTTKALSETALKQLTLLNVTQKATAQIAEQTTELDRWYRVAINSNSALSSRQAAIQKLIDQFPQYFGNLNKETASLEDLKKAYDQATDAIRKNAFAKAASDLAAEANAEVVKISDVQLKLDDAYASRKDNLIEINNLTKEQLSLLKDYDVNAAGEAFVGASGKALILSKDIDKVKISLDKQKDSAVALTEKYDELANKYTIPTPPPVITGGKPISGPGSRTIDAINEDLKNANEAWRKTVIGSKDFIELQAKIAGLEKELALADPKKTTTTDRGSRLTGDQKDAFKDIDAIRDEQLANEQRRHLEEGQLRDLTENDEITHLQKLLAINQQAINKKLSVIRGANAEERRLIADLKLDRITQEQQTNDKIFEIRKEALKNQLDDEIKNIQERDRLVQEDPTISSSGKAQSKLDADKEILQLQINFNKEIDRLEKLLGENSVKNAKENADALRKTREQIRQDDRAFIDASLKDAADAADIEAARIKQRAADRTIAVLGSNAGARQTAKELVKIQNESARELRVLEVARLKIELDLYQKGQRDKLKSEKEYQEALAKYKQAEAEIVQENIEKQISVYDRFIRTLKDFVNGFAETVLGIKKYTKEQKEAGLDVADALQQSYDAISQTINEAYRNFFDNQTAQVEREKDANIERLNIQEQQVLATAQTEGEKSSIQHQFELKRQALEKKAGEEKKKIALKELAINFAIAIIKSIAQYGLPLALIPIAAATALYFTQRANVQKQTFEKGGEVPTSKGGKITGRPHSHGGSPFTFKGRHYEAEAEELAIVRTKNAPKNKKYTVTGNQMEIASAINKIGGGKEFKRGAIIKQFSQGGYVEKVFKMPLTKFETGGFLGSSLEPPTFNSFNSSNNGISEKKIDELIEAHKKSTAETKALKEETAKRIDRLQVTQDTRTVTEAQRKQVQQNQIGTL